MELPCIQIHYEGIDGVFSDANNDNLFGVVEAFNDCALA